MDTANWTNVVAVLVAGILTGGAALGGVTLQRHYTVRDTVAGERAAAYGAFLSAVPAFVFRIEMAVAIVRLRSGLEEGISVLLLRRRPLEPLEVFDWMFRDFQSIQQAWSKIDVVGSQAAIDAADRVMDECIEYMTVAMTSDKARSLASRVLFGERWTKAKTAEVESARRAVFVAREALVAAVRTELRREPVILPIARKRLESK